MKVHHLFFILFVRRIHPVCLQSKLTYVWPDWAARWFFIRAADGLVHGCKAGNIKVVFVIALMLLQEIQSQASQRKADRCKKEITRAPSPSCPSLKIQTWWMCKFCSFQMFNCWTQYVHIKCTYTGGFKFPHRTYWTVIGSKLVAMS